jgi:hypothetical protein
MSRQHKGSTPLAKLKVVGLQQRRIPDRRKRMIAGSHLDAAPPACVFRKAVIGRKPNDDGKIASP